MQTFTSHNQVSSIKRLIYSGSPSLGTLTDTGNACTGYLRPLSEEQAAVNGLQWGIGYTLIVEVGIDIQVGDQLTIDGAIYTVRGRADHTRGFRAAYIKLLLVKPEL